MKFSRMLTVVDSHTGGNAERVATGGLPEIPGESMLAKLKHVRDHMDYLRTFLVHEPRGQERSLFLLGQHGLRHGYGTVDLQASEACGQVLGAAVVVSARKGTELLEGEA